MKKNKFALQTISFGLILLSFIACDSDFATLESDVINNDIATNFDIFPETYDVIAYTKTLKPVQTNNLALSTLGIYDDLYGRTKSSFVTQLTPSDYDPSFGDEVVIDSVVVTIPYFSTATGIDDDGKITYEVDSIISKGENFSKIELRIFENNYFIRDFDPSAEFNESQAYYSNRSASSSEMISTTALEGEELTFIDNTDSDGDVFGNIITLSEEGYILTDGVDPESGEETTVLSTETPGIRVKLDPTYWQNKIIDKEGDAVLSNPNNFTDYFRGLYFKAEPVNDDGSFLILDTSTLNGANVTIHYSKLTASTTDDEDEKDQSTFVFTFGSNKINFFDNAFTFPLNDGVPESGDSRIYLKGGEGAIAGVKLFDGDDLRDGDDNTFDDWKEFFVETDEDDGTFIRSKRLVNEANLVFYVDSDQLDLLNEDPENEPNRLYLYDLTNKAPLIDYYLDVTNSASPEFSKTGHLGALQRVDDEADGRGIKYKLKITEHINNLLLRDSTNVELGLAATLNVNIEDPSFSSSQNKIQSSDDLDDTVPLGSVLTPRGTILYGNATEPENESKRVYLEIYYTEPN
jgi:hypothetical protein